MIKYTLSVLFLYSKQDTKIVFYYISNYWLPYIHYSYKHHIYQVYVVVKFTASSRIWFKVLLQISACVFTFNLWAKPHNIER